MQTTTDLLEEDELLQLTDAERQPCEIWTRVMGYHRPVSSFNRGKQGEFNERTCFHEPTL
jgi:anaerobic ribonucleoside-triphosphate reductase